MSRIYKYTLLAFTIAMCFIFSNAQAQATKASPTVTISKLDQDTISIGDTIQITAFASDPDGGSILAYSWNCGDGNSLASSSTDSIVKCIATVGNGSQFISITVWDDDNQSSSARTWVYVLRDPPTISIIPLDRDTVSIGDTIQLQAHASDRFGKIIAYSWNCGDGNSLASSSTDSIVKCIATVGNGNQSISITVWDDDNQSSSAQTWVYVKVGTTNITKTACRIEYSYFEIQDAKGRTIWRGFGNIQQIKKRIPQGKYFIKKMVP